jgi:hypothetical protein
VALGSALGLLLGCWLAAGGVSLAGMLVARASGVPAWHAANAAASHKTAINHLRFAAPDLPDLVSPPKKPFPFNQILKSQWFGGWHMRRLQQRRKRSPSQESACTHYIE